MTLTREGYHAFLPAPLPPKLRYDDALVLALSKADTALSELAGVGRTLPNPHLFIMPYVLREAVLSTRIEGTQAGVSDFLLDEVGEKTSTQPADRQEVQNYIQAMEYGCKRLSDLPLSRRLVCEIHAHLLNGVRGKHSTPGEVRRSQNWIGGTSPADAVYVPPPIYEMDNALTLWESYLHERDKYPPLIQCALMHEHFESIHPFLDGNGRIGRLLITLFLIERGRLTRPMLYLSAYIEATKGQYYDCLQRIRTHGDWRSWLLYFLGGVTQAAADAARQAGHLMDLWRDYEYRLRNEPRAHVLLPPLFANPYMTVARAEKILRVSTPTARKAVLALEAHGMLENVPQSPWRRLYMARPILDSFEPAEVSGA